LHRYLFITLIFYACTNASNYQHTNRVHQPGGNTIETRFTPPADFQRVAVSKGSFATYLRQLPLKPEGTLVKYYNGSIKDDDAYIAVVDMDISNKDLQQCADAIMRLRGEYLFANGFYDRISFRLTNGFQVDYHEWIKGKRVNVSGNETSWIQRAKPSNTYNDFRNYMEFIFTYAGTRSLAKELHSKSLQDISIGDVFIQAGSPGHAVIDVDVAVNNKGEKVFMLAQSYMPAQETQILRNNNDRSMSPWYSASFSGTLQTPQWTFNATDLKTW
jgi:hypothetical protein